MEKTTTTEKTKWWESDWYKEWEKRAKESHVEIKLDGYWVCYNNEKNELIYEYVRM